MEFRQLRSAVSVARHGSFTRAAEALAIAQPALSQHVAALEAELGLRLFERTNRRVSLTEAGRIFVGRAEQILSDIETARAEMADHACGRGGRVTIGTYQSFAEYALPKLLGRFHAAHPGIDVALREGLTEELLAALQERRIDVFIGEFDDTSRAEMLGVRNEPLYEDEVVLAVGGQHRLAARPTVRMEELRDEPFVIFGPGSSSTYRLNVLARAAGFTPRAVFQSVDSLTVRSLVAEGLGVALYPRLLGNMPGPHVALLSFEPRIIRRMSLIARNERTGPAVDRFVEFIREERFAL